MNKSTYFPDDVAAKIDRAVSKKKAKTFNGFVVEAVKEKLTRDKIK